MPPTVFIVSDGTGITAETFAHSILSQFDQKFRLVRVPFVDHRLMEFAASLPIEFKLRKGRGKFLLREILRRYLAPSLTERPKQGFAIPIAEWLRGPLREWAEELLSSSALSRSGILNAAPVRDAWREHLAGRGNHQHRLWAILMLQSWFQAAPETTP